MKKGRLGRTDDLGQTHSLAEWVCLDEKRVYPEERGVCLEEKKACLEKRDPVGAKNHPLKGEPVSVLLRHHEIYRH